MIIPQKLNTPLYGCITGLVRCAGKYIANDDYTMYNESHVDRRPKLKRRSTRHVSEITAIASEFGNSAKIIVPRSWLRKRRRQFWKLRSYRELALEQFISDYDVGRERKRYVKGSVA